MSRSDMTPEEYPTATQWLSELQAMHLIRPASGNISSHNLSRQCLLKINLSLFYKTSEEAIFAYQLVLLCIWTHDSKIQTLDQETCISKEQKTS